MRVLLINPPRENEISGCYPSLVTEERGYNPPLGLLYLAGYLERHTTHHITIIDSQVERLDYQRLKSRIASVRPDLVGITALTWTLVDVVKTINTVKEVDQHIKIVLGGPHVHLYPEETINLKNVDYLVLGEGEKTFKELLDYLDDKARLKKIGGLVFKENGLIINTGMSEPITNLDDLPFPARHLVPYQKYTSLLAKGPIATTVFTSRGCPFGCSFCDRRHLGKVFRARSPQNVVAELKACVKMGIYEFLFYDDTFTLDKKRAIDICKEIIANRLDISWDIRTRVDIVDEELIGYLRKAGCHGIHYGVEAGTEKILQVLNKNITLRKVRETFELTQKYKIPILAYFIIGNPSETREDIYTTFRVMKSLNPDYVLITILTLFPGTKIYYDALEKGVIKKDCWREFSKNPTTDFMLPYWEEILPRDELNELLIKGYKNFYMRPAYILKSLKTLRSFQEFKKKALAGFKVLTAK